MSDIATMFNIMEWIGAAMVPVAVIFMIKIAKMTGWFKAWTLLSTAFSLIFVRRVITSYAPLSNFKTELGYLNSVISLVLSVLYIISFYMFYLIFKKQAKQKKLLAS